MPQRPQMLPFIDLLFASLGIFITVFTVTIIVADQEQRPPLADVVIVGLDNCRFSWIDRFAGRQS